MAASSNTLFISSKHCTVQSRKCVLQIMLLIPNTWLPLQILTVFYQLQYWLFWSLCLKYNIKWTKLLSSIWSYFCKGLIGNYKYKHSLSQSLYTDLSHFISRPPIPFISPPVTFLKGREHSRIGKIIPKSLQPMIWLIDWLRCSSRKYPYPSCRNFSVVCFPPLVVL